MRETRHRSALTVPHRIPGRAKPFPVSAPAISRHLKVLGRAGLIARSREAQWRPSRLQADPLDEAAEWMQSRKRTWEARMDDSMRTMSDPAPAAADQEVLITRIFEAPRERVFRAWTDPDQVAAWYGPERMYAPRERIRIDLRVGGRWEADDGPARRRRLVRDSTEASERTRRRA